MCGVRNLVAALVNLVAALVAVLAKCVSRIPRFGIQSRVTIEIFEIEIVTSV